MSNTFNCDSCGEIFPKNDRFPAMLQRPSNPSEMVAVLWFCPACGKASHMHHHSYWTDEYLGSEQAKLDGVISVDA